MRKFILLALLLQTFLAYAQYEPLENHWEYYGELHPDINAFDNLQAVPDRTLLFFTEYTSGNPPGEVLFYDTKTQRWQVYPTLDLFGVVIRRAFWYPHTKESYFYLAFPLAAKEKTGLYKLSLDQETVVRGEQMPFLWPNPYMLPDIVLDDNERLVSYFLTAERNGERLEAFSIYADDGTELWSYSTKKHSYRETTVFWLGGKWLFRHYGVAGMTAGIEFNKYDHGIHHAIFNYKTGEERNYFPEVIIGYGKDHIITTSKELTGLTIRNLDNEIVYRDLVFKLAELPEDIRLKPLLGFAMLDYPYLYYSVHLHLYFRFYYTMALNLETNQAHRVVDGRLLGIFDRGGEQP
jgi:hypothetical protein